MAALVLSPLMVHAQATTSSAHELQSNLEPKGLILGAATNAAITTPRISTGVVAPQLVKQVEVELSTEEQRFVTPDGEPKVTIAMVVDKTGKPSQLKVVESTGGILLNRDVLAAVSQYRYRPATVSGEAIDFPLNLEVVVQSR